MFQRKKIVYILLLPGMIGIMAFYIVPFFGGIYYSLMDGTFENNFVGFANYERVLNNKMFQLGLHASHYHKGFCKKLLHKAFCTI